MRLRLHTALVVSCCVSACTTDDDPLPASRLEVVRAPASVIPGEPTPQTLIVRVLDDMGQSAHGALVQWAAAPGSGSLTQSADTTGLDGLASAEWLPGLAEGEQEISVTIYGQPAARIRVRASAFHADKIAASYRDGCGLAGTAVWCWAHASFYGPNATITRVLPQLSVADIAVSSGYVCALDAAGATFCHSNFDALPPESYVTPEGLPPIRGISAGGSTFCGIAIADNTAWCWNHNRRIPVQISAGLQLASVSVWGFVSCGLTAAGEAWCWEGSSAPVAVPGGHTFRMISVGQFSTCAIGARTTLYCWSESNAPVAIAGVTAAQVALGTFDEGVLNTSSSAAVFSLNSSDAGEFGLGEGVLPVPARGVADHCALTFDGTVFCALPANGSNSFGPYRWVAIPAPTPP